MATAFYPRRLNRLLIASLFLPALAFSNDAPAPKVPAPGTAQAALSPANWDPATRARLDAMTAEFAVDKPLATGKHGVIAGTTSATAVHAGLVALEQGGTAADALVTTSLTEIALANGAWVSYAGILTMMYYDAATGRVYNLNGAYDTVRGETSPLTIPTMRRAAGDAWTPSGRTALVPGYMATAEAVHKRFGKLPWDSLFEPAIYFAANGHRLHSLHESMIDKRRDVLSRLPETKAIFTKPDGTFYRRGDLLRQPQLAQTLRHVAKDGAAYMYTGAWAHKLVEAVQRDGGKMTLEDLAKYQPLWAEPVRTQYHGYEVAAHGLPAKGGVNIIEALNVADAADVRGMGRYDQSPQAFFWLAQIARLTTIEYLPEAMRNTIYGGNLTLEERTKPAHARELWAQMKSGKMPVTQVPKTLDDKHSDAVVVIDQWGNIAVATHTINTSTWGDTGIFVDGISIPDSAAIQQAAVAAAGPGGRVADPTEPLLALQNGKPVFGLSSIGGGLHQKTFSVLLNLLDYGTGLKQAIDSPSQHAPAFEGNAMRAQVITGEFSPTLLEGVRALGLQVNEVGNSLDMRAPRGYVIGVQIDRQTGIRKAAGTQLLNGAAFGY
jgi:gamma-glutamyltranspeptidase/glutathione hydrolase